MAENIEDLRGYLFRMLKKLENASADELEDESVRAKSMTGIARILVETGRIEKMPGHGGNGGGVFFSPRDERLAIGPVPPETTLRLNGDLTVERFSSAKTRTARITKLLSEGYKMLEAGVSVLKEKEMTVLDHDGVYYLRIG